MKSVIQKIFCLLWLLLFLQSALEVNACGIENTFNDEYDSYIDTYSPPLNILHSVWII